MRWRLPLFFIFLFLFILFFFLLSPLLPLLHHLLSFLLLLPLCSSLLPPFSPSSSSSSTSSLHPSLLTPPTVSQQLGIWSNVPQIILDKMLIQTQVCLVSETTLLPQDTVMPLKGLEAAWQDTRGVLREGPDVCNCLTVGPLAHSFTSLSILHGTARVYVFKS